MTQVTEPFPIFYDDDGTPLENGMIYVGEANQDPRVNPVAVFFDEALTVPAAQPIRTLGGRPAYQGAPARMYIAEAAYSIEVQNAFGSPVTGPTEGAVITVADVSFTASGTGAVARTVQSKLRDTVSVKDFGAVGDGVADDRAAFIAALATNPGELFIPDGHYLLSQGVELPSNLTIKGNGRKSRITSTGTNKRVLWAEGKQNIHIEGVFIEGNLTGGEFNPATGDTGGDGLWFRNCQNVTVHGCWFDRIGQNTTASVIGASCVAAMLTDGIKVTNCTFLENCFSTVGADVNVAYYVRNSVVSNNVSRSEHDLFFSGPAVGVTALDTSCHTITGNIARRSLTTRARSGIIADYGRGAYATISGNVMAGFNWNGFYVASPQEDQNGSGIAVSGNVSLHCGGGSAGESGISAGFYLSGKLGTASSGNIAIKTGYKEDGTTRLAPVSGFMIVGASRAVALAGCIARDGRGFGLEIRVIPGTTMDTVNISGFESYDNLGGHVLIDVQAASSTLRNVVLTGPILRSTADQGRGIRVIQGDTNAVPVNFQINGGEIVGPGKATSTQAAFYTNAATLPKWSIRGVLFSGWQTGIDLINGAIGDKEVGDTATIADCHFDDCGTGISMGIDAGKYAMIERCTFTNCTNNTNNPGRIITSAVSFGQDPLNASKKVWQFYRASVPTDGTWSFGSVCYLTNSGLGEHVGARVTNPAGAGTWTRFAGMRDTAAAIANPTDAASTQAAVISILAALRANATILSS